MSEDKIKEMARLLTSGATMLAEPCPKCGSPLLKSKDGKVVCPACGFTRDGTKRESTPEVSTVRQPLSNEALLSALKQKVSLLVEKLEKTEDLREIKEIVETIKLLLDLIKQVSQ